VAFLGGAGSLPAQPQVEPDKLHVVSNRLEGDWKAMPDLTKRFKGGWLHPISFHSDPSVVGKLSKEFAQKLKGERIYLAGNMTWGPRKIYPFFLITSHGNPTLVYLREKGDDPFGDMESFLILLVVGKDGANDILFIGPESIAIPRGFSAYERRKLDDTKPK